MIPHQKKTSFLKVAIVGNPNSGKSTLFNALTGLRQKTGNFPGVTVDKKIGSVKIIDPNTKEVFTIQFIDLPGTYSLYPKSQDEAIACEILCNPAHEYFPDIIIVVADATNLKRSLLLATQVMDLQIPMLLALNMIDLVEKNGTEINIELLSEKLGVKIIPVSARNEKGIDGIRKVLVNPIKIPSSCFFEIRQNAHVIAEKITQINNRVTSEYGAIHYLYNSIATNYSPKEDEATAGIKKIITENKFDLGRFQSQENIERYRKIEHIIDGCVKWNVLKQSTLTTKLDKIFTHKVGGYLIFLSILFIIFQSIFFLAAFPMQWIESSFIFLSDFSRQHLPPGELSSLFTNGILAGLSGVVVFIPQIALLFAFIGIMEDTGYMARVSFIMDRLLKKFGLNGKSVIPLVSSVACAVPAIMSARTIANWKERIITIMVVPLMSCSARLPVYTLLTSLVVPEEKILGFFNLQGVVLMLLYLVGFLAALLVALIMKYIIKAREKSYFIMELPVYRVPVWRSIGITMLDKVKVFLFDAGKIIIAISIILWMLSSHGPSNTFSEIEKKYTTQQMKDSLTTKELEIKTGTEKLEASYAGILGKKIEPVIAPLGFDWKIGIALVTSFAAREVFVGTMATIYSVEDTGEHETIKQKMMADIDPKTGKRKYSLALAFSLMVFYAFAMQCMSTIAIVYRETQSWKWPLIQFIYMGVLAYVASWVVYRIFS